jgi:superfamily II DNA/RNA helicase
MIYPVKRAQPRETSSSRSKVSCLTFNRFAVEENEEDFETNWDLVVNKFDDMGLKEPVLRGIYGYGFKEPSPIQQKGILPVIQGKDTIA